MKQLERILFIGAGNMASAIIHGAVGAGVLDLERVAVVDPNAEKRGDFHFAFEDANDGVEWLEAGGSDGVIVLAVKPQMLDAASAPVCESLRDAQPLVVSILAGTRSSGVLQAMGDDVRVIRVMPNTPAAIGMGMSAIAKGPGATESDLDLANALFGAIGKTIEIDESMMDAFTGLAGSGPAYVFYLAEGLINAATEMGFSAEQAQTIVSQTILGSAMLMDRSDETPGALRTQVTSKGGTTAAGIGALDNVSVLDAIKHAAIAARDRGIELGKS